MLLRKYFKKSLPLLGLAFLLWGAAPDGRLAFPPRPAFAQPAGTEQGGDNLPLPAPKESATRSLSPGEAHSYRVALDAGQYLHVVVERQGIDSGVAVYGPDEQALVRLDCRRDRPTPVSLIAETSGVYRLEVRAQERGQAQGRYELRVGEVRPATPKDGYRVAAERAFAEAERLLKEWRAESTRAAVEKYQEALASWKAAGDSLEEVYTLERIGDAYPTLGEYGGALPDYEQALALSRKIGDRRGEADSLAGIGLVYKFLGQYRRALEHCRGALELSRAAGYHRGEARALNNIGEVHYDMGEYPRSFEFYEQALPLWNQIGDPQGQAQTLLNCGKVKSDLGQAREAFDFFNRAYALWQAAGERRGQALTLTSIGRLYNRVGESQSALDFFERAMRIIRPIGDSNWEGSILNGIGYVYQGLGEEKRALEYYSRALPLFRSVNNSRAVAGTLHEMGAVYLFLEDYEKALDAYRQSLSMYRATGNKRGEAYTLKGIGTVYDAEGDKSKALENFISVRSFYQAEKDLRGEADTLNLMGRVYEGQDRTRQALACYDRALSLSREAEYRFGEAATLYNLARFERARGDLARARAQTEAALGVVESLRAKVASQDLRASYFASVRQLYELYVSVLMELHARQPSEGFDAAAFEASERARARSLLETLAAARVGLRRNADPELRERERSLREQMSGAAERRARLLAGGHAEGELAAADREIDELTERYREVDTQIRAAGAENSVPAQTRPLTLKEVQEQVVDDDTVLLEFSLGEERSYLWAVTKTAVASYELPRRAEIEGAAGRVRELLTAPQPLPGETFEARQARAAEAEGRYWQEAAALSETLLGPAAASLKARRLLVVADGALQYIPFGALPEPGSGEAAPLMLRHEVTFQPSASALATLRGETAGRGHAEKAVAVFADPVFERDDSRIAEAGAGLASGLLKKEDAAAQDKRGQSEVHKALRDAGVDAGGHIQRLLSSREEAEAIMGVTPSGVGLKAVGFDADKATATSPSLGEYRIIHFATHGILDSEHPELSGLVLSLYDKYGQPQDGFLRLNDIYNLELPADMVVLSACNTGLGKDVKGEGLIGLTRGFMYAGVPRVVASLWKVDDEATAELMKHFYRNMLREKKSPAEALREAQVALWQQKQWRAPYFWAAFVLQGEYEGTIEVAPQERTPAAPALWAAAALAAGLCGLYLVRRGARRRKRHE